MQWTRSGNAHRLEGGLVSILVSPADTGWWIRIAIGGRVILTEDTDVERIEQALAFSLDLADGLLREELDAMSRQRTALQPNTPH